MCSTFSIYVLKIKFPMLHLKVVNDLQVAYQKTYFISLLDLKVYTLAGGSVAVLFFCFCFLLCPNDAVTDILYIHRTFYCFQLGPRLCLQLIKIQEGMCSGEVLFHEFGED